MGICSQSYIYSSNGPFLARRFYRSNDEVALAIICPIDVMLQSLHVTR